MPPVFGPVSPSPIRLWSCAVPKASTSSPSASTKKLASSPAMNSSTTISAPGPARSRSTASWASPGVPATTTPLPAASPSAFTTMGAPFPSIYSCAGPAASNRAQPAVGTPAASQISFVKAFDTSSRAAAAEGPKTETPASRSLSATPAASGASGPTITRSIAFSSAKTATSPPSSMSIEAHSAIPAIPALPGATISRSHLGFCFTAQARACSRPPPPSIRMFMARFPFVCGRSRVGLRGAQDERKAAAMDLIDDPQPGENAPEFTVTEISGAVKRVIEGEFGRVRVRGEVGRVFVARSGHLYFDLKDDRNVLASVSWKGQVSALTTKPEEGMEVIATGRMTTFGSQSKYQLNVEDIRPAGIGALMAMLEKRKKALAAEGLFDEALKRPIPYLPEVIGVVTSPSGAVIRDILHRLRERFPRKVLVWPVAVQGERCAPEVAAAIAGFNALTPGGAVPRRARRLARAGGRAGLGRARAGPRPAPPAARRSRPSPAARRRSDRQRPPASRLRREPARPGPRGGSRAKTPRSRRALGRRAPGHACRSVPRQGPPPRCLGGAPRPRAPPLGRRPPPLARPARPAPAPWSGTATALCRARTPSAPPRPSTSSSPTGASPWPPAPPRRNRARNLPAAANRGRFSDPRSRFHRPSNIPGEPRMRRGRRPPSQVPPQDPTRGPVQVIGSSVNRAT